MQRAHDPGVHPQCSGSNTGMQTAVVSKAQPRSLAQEDSVLATDRQARLQEHRSVSLSLRHARRRWSRQTRIQPSTRQVSRLGLAAWQV